VDRTRNRAEEHSSLPDRPTYQRPTQYLLTMTRPPIPPTSRTRSHPLPPAPTRSHPLPPAPTRSHPPPGHGRAGPHQSGAQLRGAHPGPRGRQQVSGHCFCTTVLLPVAARACMRPVVVVAWWRRTTTACSLHTASRD
jgi:hypothetical protein